MHAQPPPAALAAGEAVEDARPPPAAAALAFGYGLNEGAEGEAVDDIAKFPGESQSTARTVDLMVRPSVPLPFRRFTAPALAPPDSWGKARTCKGSSVAPSNPGGLRRGMRVKRRKGKGTPTDVVLPSFLRMPSGIVGAGSATKGQGHNYLTLVYQIDDGVKRLLYLATIRERASKAVHVLDRYHIMAKMNKAIDEIRASEAKQLKADGYEPILKHSRWCLLKRPENRTEKETMKLAELMKYNLKSVPTCCGRTYNGSGRTPLRDGRANSCAIGARARGPCARGLNRYRRWQAHYVNTRTFC